MTCSFRGGGGSSRFFCLLITFSWGLSQLMCIVQEEFDGSARGRDSAGLLELKHAEKK